MTIEIMIYALIFMGVLFFALVGVEIFNHGWVSYEERYVRGAAKTLDSIYLTIPAQHLLYISLAGFFLVIVFVALLTGSWIFGLVAGLAALAAPNLIIKWLKARRERRFAEQLVDALGSMSNALRAGLSLNQAIDIIHQEMDNPIAQEFRIVAHEMRFGTQVGEALDHLRGRIANPDLALMATAVGVAQEVGGNLASVFDNISAMIRERHRVESRIQVLTAQGRMQGWILSFTPVGLAAILTMVYPEMMRPLYETPAGWGIIGVSIVMTIIGSIFINRIVSIDI